MRLKIRLEKCLRLINKEMGLQKMNLQECLEGMLRSNYDSLWLLDSILSINDLIFKGFIKDLDECMEFMMILKLLF